MADNKDLNAAAINQRDEFYTQFWDIQEEMNFYWEHFKGAKILCNCDDPFESNFFRWFAIQFANIGLKKLTATCYAGSSIAQKQLSLFDEDLPTSNRTPYCATLTELRDFNGDGRVDYSDIEWALRNIPGALRKLTGNGDFRSPECLELLKDADIVVTNPPHSLLREYIALLFKYSKKFIILGNINAITYKDVFPLFMHNKIWLGKTIHSGDRKFNVPDTYPLEAAGCGIDDDGRKFIRVKGVRWFTNLKYSSFVEPLFLFRRYHEHPENYPYYDNYHAIDVKKTADIPGDWPGVMGVPITFIDKYDPEQFEILGLTEKDSPYAFGNGKRDRPYINGQRMYARILIRRKNMNDGSDIGLHRPQ